MAGGRIVRSGGPELADELEQTGYAWVDGAAPEVGVAAGARR
jgi:Fe-S cluster assembly ATP-binding protein